MKLDVVYPLIEPHRRNNGFELRCSLRSLEEQDWVGDVYVVGHRPAWIRDVIHIECDDPYKPKDPNIIGKVLKACADERVSDRFVVNSDDHYILRPVTLDELGPWVENPSRWEDCNRRYLASWWCRRMVDTVMWCRRNGHPDFVLQSHIPYVVDKELYPKVMAQAPWAEGNGLTTHVYFNLTLRDEPPAEDAGTCARFCRASQKVDKKTEGARFANNNDPGLRSLKPFLEKRFPTPSRWET